MSRGSHRRRTRKPFHKGGTVEKRPSPVYNNGPRQRRTGFVYERRFYPWPVDIHTVPLRAEFCQQGACPLQHRRRQYVFLTVQAKRDQPGGNIGVRSHRQGDHGPRHTKTDAGRVRRAADGRERQAGIQGLHDAEGPGHRACPVGNGKEMEQAHIRGPDRRGEADGPVAFAEDGTQRVPAGARRFKMTLSRTHSGM